MCTLFDSECNSISVPFVVAIISADVDSDKYPFLISHFNTFREMCVDLCV